MSRGVTAWSSLKDDDPGPRFELAFDFERRRVDERETFEPRNVAGMGIEREAFAAMERRARGGGRWGRWGWYAGRGDDGGSGTRGERGESERERGRGGDSGAPGGAAEDVQGGLRRLEGIAKGATERPRESDGVGTGKPRRRFFSRQPEESNPSSRDHVQDERLSGARVVYQDGRLFARAERLFVYHHHSVLPEASRRRRGRRSSCCGARPTV